MTLPLRPLPEAVVPIAGQDVPIRGLTLAEVRTIRKCENDVKSDLMAIAWSCSITQSEAEAFFSNAPAADTVALLQAIMDLSGLGDDARFQGGTGNDDGASRVPVTP